MLILTKLEDRSGNIPYPITPDNLTRLLVLNTLIIRKKQCFKIVLI